MPLSVHEKAFISDVVSHSLSIFQLYAIKRRFLNAYVLLWNQKNPYIRQAIAKHFGKEIFAGFSWKNQQYSFLEIEKFFTESLLAIKIQNDLIRQIFTNSQATRSPILKTIDIDYHQKLTLTLNEIYKGRIVDAKAAKDIFDNNIKDLKKWVKNSNCYISEENHRQIKAQNNSFFYIAVGVFAITYTLLTAYEDEYAFFKALTLALSVYFTHELYRGVKSTFLYANGIYNIHLNLISLEDYEEEHKVAYERPSVKPQKFKHELVNTKPHYPAALAVVIDKNPPSQWSDSIEDLPAYKKIKTRKAAPQATPIENLPVTVSIENPRPDFFGNEFKELDDNHIVAIDPNNLGKNNSFFGIWNKPKITRFVGDGEPIYHKLFSIFSMGNIAGKKGSTGIKYLRNLNFFEIKTPSTAARVYGDEIIQASGNTALVFSHFSRKGFH